MSDAIAVLSAKRTPIGGLMGSLSSMSAPTLGGLAIAAVVEGSGLEVSDIDEVLMGSVLTAGQGQAPARQAALAAGIPNTASCSTVNKVCGSGMKSIMLAANALRCGQINVAIAGGMESMSGAPYLAPQARQGYRFGHAQLLDHMQFDGLQDAYQGVAMGNFAEICASRYAFTRAEQDAYALESLKRANSAIDEGYFVDEIIPITIESRRGNVHVERDEQPGNAKPDKIPLLKPAFQKDGTVTAANASSISDGASAVSLMMLDQARQRGMMPLAVIRGYSESAHEPEWFTTAPVTAIKKTLKAVGWCIEDVDLWEINEAFAVVPMAAIKELGLSHDKVNVHGGACALGHPIGASGTRIVTTLIHAMRRIGAKKGIASLCIGGGEATALAIEIV
ncbi:thiolase family protein [Porticoccaceae bacterium]|nr:thiolase family protein [Porticoccaceae bacterium]MDA8651626.1 thiolase family protein [Porticoccaceae bacterium]MDA8663514.1 thiolase family protein [Porticoccaceae bacterium]MDA8682569.1 thiolase family protein [Porticoccaceae bacterium]MDA8788794.1 thiolase family protein [Porticoccaceae bacterium]